MARNRIVRGALIGSVLALALPAQALAIQVTTTQDGTNLAGQCTLREAVTAANTGIDPHNDCVGGTDGPDTINIPASATRYIVGGFGAGGEDANAGKDLDIMSDITFVGAGAANTLVDGGQADRVFHIIGPRTVELRDLTVTDGKTNTPATPGAGVPGTASANGGGILNGGDLTLTRVVVDNNATGRGGNGGPGPAASNPGDDSTGGLGGNGGHGGGIYSTGNSLTLVDSTVSNNVAGNGGLGGNGAPAGDATGTTGAPGGTSSGNNGGAGGSGGGIYALNGTLTLTRSQIKSNTGGDGGKGGNGGFGGDGAQNTGGVGGSGGDSFAGDGGFGGDGGGITLDSSFLSPMTDSTVADNRSGAGGAGGNSSAAGHGGNGSTTNGAGGDSSGGDGEVGGDNGGISGSDGGQDVSGSTISGNFAGTGGEGGTAMAGGNAGDGSSGVGGSSLGGDGGTGGLTGGVGHSAGSAIVGYTNVTISGNSAGGGGNGASASSAGSGSVNGTSEGGDGGQGGGRAAVRSGVTLSLTHVTISFNGNGPGGAGASPGGTSGTGGQVGGIFVAAGTTTLRSSIVANNEPNQCAGSFASTDNNLEFPAPASCPATITSDPALDALADHGGPTFTWLLGPGSGALNTNTGFCSPTDQRGVTRPKGGGCDLGAVEMSPPAATTGAASSVTSSGARLAGTVDTGQLPTTSKFQYGTTTAYGSEASGSGTSPSATLTGLQPNTTYHYRLTATNPDGTANGEDKTFKTGAAPAAGGGGGGPAAGGGGDGGTVASFRGLRFLLRSVRVDSRRRASIRVSCPADSDGNCAGTLSLSARLTFVITSQASRKRKRTIKFGKKKFSIAKGKSARVRIKLPKKAFRILRTRKRVKATLVAVTHDARNKNKTTKRKITLKAPKPR